MKIIKNVEMRDVGDPYRNDGKFYARKPGGTADFNWVGHINHAQELPQIVASRIWNGMPDPVDVNPANEDDVVASAVARLGAYPPSFQTKFLQKWNGGSGLAVNAAGICHTPGNSGAGSTSSSDSSLMLASRKHLTGNFSTPLTPAEINRRNREHYAKQESEQTRGRR